MRPGGLEPPTS